MTAAGGAAAPRGQLYARRCIVTAAVLLAAAVACGAFGAHMLKPRLAADMLAVYQTAVQYHAWHALGLLAIGLFMLQRPAAAGLALSAALLFAGIVLFSGSLYLLALTQWRWPGAVAPLGGLAFIAGWIALALAAWRAM